MTTMKEIIGKMDSLKPISPVVTRIMQVAGDDEGQGDPTEELQPRGPQVSGAFFQRRVYFTQGGAGVQVY